MRVGEDAMSMQKRRILSSTSYIWHTRVERTGHKRSQIESNPIVREGDREVHRQTDSESQSSDLSGRLMVDAFSGAR